MTQSMIEKVARALRASFVARIEELSGETFSKCGVSIPPDDVWQRYAKAAIGAMAEPTYEMGQTASANVITFDIMGNDVGVSIDEANEVWKAMIQAALKG